MLSPNFRHQSPSDVARYTKKKPEVLSTIYIIPIGIFSAVPSDTNMCPEVDSASENEYQGFRLGKGGRCIWLTTYPPCSAESREDPGP